MVKNLSCVSYGSLKRFPHTFTSSTQKTDAYVTKKSLKNLFSDFFHFFLLFEAALTSGGLHSEPLKYF